MSFRSSGTNPSRVPSVPVAVHGTPLPEHSGGTQPCPASCQASGPGEAVAQLSVPGREQSRRARRRGQGQRPRQGSRRHTSGLQKKSKGLGTQLSAKALAHTQDPTPQKVLNMDRGISGHDKSLICELHRQDYRGWRPFPAGTSGCRWSLLSCHLGNRCTIPDMWGQPRTQVALTMDVTSAPLAPWTPCPQGTLARTRRQLGP